MHKLKLLIITKCLIITLGGILFVESEISDSSKFYQGGQTL